MQKSVQPGWVSWCRQLGSKLAPAQGKCSRNVSLRLRHATPCIKTRPSCACALQEIARPDIFWYDAPTKVDLPFNIVGLLAFEFWAMQFVELKRWQDFKNPGSVDQDPLFPNNKLQPHDVRMPAGLFYGLSMSVVPV
jgi:hypothetical protein